MVRCTLSIGPLNYVGAYLFGGALGGTEHDRIQSNRVGRSVAEFSALAIAL